MASGEASSSSDQKKADWVSDLLIPQDFSQYQVPVAMGRWSLQSLVSLLTDPQSFLYKSYHSTSSELREKACTTYSPLANVARDHPTALPFKVRREGKGGVEAEYEAPECPSYSGPQVDPEEVQHI